MPKPHQNTVSKMGTVVHAFNLKLRMLKQEACEFEADWTTFQASIGYLAMPRLSIIKKFKQTKTPNC